MDSTVIRTERLVLRRYRLEDVDAFFAMFSNPEAMRYWSTLPVTDIEMTRRWVAKMIAAGPPEVDDFVVELDGQVIGKAGVYASPEVGFMFHPDHWRRGYAKEAMAAIVPHAFGVLPTDRLIADVDPDNAGSLALLRGLGFEVTGRAEKTFRLGDVWVDSVYLALSRERFLARAKG